MIPVVWYEPVHGNDPRGRSRYALCTMLNEAFDILGCEHWNTFERLPADRDGAIIMLHGGNLYHENPLVADRISAQCKNLKYVVFIIFGDDDAEFPVHDLRHPNMRVWQQMPNPRRLYADRYFIVGYPNDCREMISLAGGPEKNWDWFFAGQDMNDRRHACVNMLRSLNYIDEQLVATDGFGRGLDHPTYFYRMAKAKVVPCPSGPATPDTYRMAEALEAGAVPVIDAVSLNGVEGYWDLVLPGHPFPVVKDWSEFPAKLEEILADYDRWQRLCHWYWLQYKIRFRSRWLQDDLRSLGVVI